MPSDHKSKDFTYTAESGQSLTLPLRLKVGTLRKARKLEEVDFAFTIIESIADEKSLEVIDEMDAAEMRVMFEQWQRAYNDRAGASLPE